MTNDHKKKILKQIRGWPGFAVWINHFTPEERQVIQNAIKMGVVESFVKVPARVNLEDVDYDLL